MIRQWLRTLIAILVLGSAWAPGVAASPAAHAARTRFDLQQPTGPCADPRLVALLGLINAFRAQAGRQPLVFSTSLTAAAQHHAESMATFNYFDYTLTPENITFDQNIKNFGYPGSYLGTDIAAGVGSTDPATVFGQWQVSPSQAANLLNPRFRAIGLGYAMNPDASFVNYWVATLGDDVSDAATCPPPATPAAVAPTIVPTALPTSTATASPTGTATASATARPSDTPTVPATEAFTATVAPSATATPSKIATSIPVAASTPHPSTTPTASVTATSIPTETATETETGTPAPTATRTPVPTLPPTAAASPVLTPASPAAKASPLAPATPIQTAIPQRVASPFASPVASPFASPVASPIASPVASPASPEASPEAASPIAATPVSAARCMLSRDSAKAGQDVAVACVGFQPGEKVNVYFDQTRASDLLGSIAADQNGAGTMTFLAPEIPGGRFVIIAFGAASSAIATAPFELRPGIFLTPKSGDPGDVISADLTGFQADETVIITWYDTVTSTRLLRTVMAGEDGSLTTTFRAPGSTAGTHTIEATGQSGASATTTFDLTSGS